MSCLQPLFVQATKRGLFHVHVLLGIHCYQANCNEKRVIFPLKAMNCAVSVQDLMHKFVYSLSIDRKQKCLCTYSITHLKAHFKRHLKCLLAVDAAGSHVDMMSLAASL